MNNQESRVRELLESSGLRPEVPAGDLATIKAAFRAEWESRYRDPAETTETLVPREIAATSETSETTATGHYFGRRRVLALAASLLIAAATLLWWQSNPAPGLAQVARVEALNGTVTATQHEGATSRLELAAGRPTLAAGTVVETAGDDQSEPGWISLRLAGGSGVRLAAGSRLQLLSESVLQLDRGALYVDSGVGPQRGAPIEVRTAYGSATDIGTQFEVRLLEAGNAAMRVRVREGRVEIADETGSYSADRGAEVTLHADGRLERARIEVYGEGWSWVLAAAPQLTAEEMTLGEFLAWTSRETGWQVHFETTNLEASTSAIIQGSFGELPADQAHTVVLPSVGLQGTVDDGILMISLAR